MENFKLAFVIEREEFLKKEPVQFWSKYGAPFANLFEQDFFQILFIYRKYCLDITIVYLISKACLLQLKERLIEAYLTENYGINRP